MSAGKKDGKKLADTEIRLIFFLLGVIVFALSYNFLYKEFVAEQDALEIQKTSLNREVLDLKKIEKNKAKYENDVVVMKGEIDAVVESVPSDAKVEDNIIYVADLETNHNMKVSNLGLGEPEALYMMNQSGNNEIDNGKILYKVPLNISTIVSYKDIKETLTAIDEDQEKKAVDKITLTYDEETGDLQGDITVNAYYLLNSGKEYVAKVNPDVNLGRDNIFGANND